MQSDLFFLVREFLASTLARILVSCESGSGFEIHCLETLRVFLPCHASNLDACHLFLRAAIRDPLPSSRVRRTIRLRGFCTPDFDLTLRVRCAVFSSCLERFCSGISGPLADVAIFSAGSWVLSFFHEFSLFLHVWALDASGSRCVWFEC